MQSIKKCQQIQQIYVLVHACGYENKKTAGYAGYIKRQMSVSMLGMILGQQRFIARGMVPHQDEGG